MSISYWSRVESLQWPSKGGALVVEKGRVVLGGRGASI